MGVSISLLIGSMRLVRDEVLIKSISERRSWALWQLIHRTLIICVVVNFSMLVLCNRRRSLCISINELPQLRWQLNQRMFYYWKFPFTLWNVLMYVRMILWYLLSWIIGCLIMFRLSLFSSIFSSVIQITKSIFILIEGWHDGLSFIAVILSGQFL